MSYNLPNELSKKGIKCLSIFGSNREFIEKKKNYDFYSFKVKSIFNNTYPLFGLGFFFKVKEIIGNNPDAKIIIHSRHLTSSFLASLACRIAKHPYTIVEHNAGPVYFNSSLVTSIANFVDKYIFASVLTHSEDILAVSQTGKQWISKTFDIPIKRIGVIYNSVDIKYDTTKLKNKENIVIFASKWITVKDPQTTLNAYKLIANKYPDWQFLMIGDGKNLQYNSQNLPKNIIIKNKLIKQNELFKILEKSKIYINSSLSEGLSLGEIEAIGYGNIPVLSDAESNKEVSKLLETQEFIFTRKKPKELAKTIEKAIIKSKNTKYIEKLVDRNKKLFSTNQMIETYYQRLFPTHYQNKQMAKISIIIPLYNEETSIIKLLTRVSNVHFPNNITKEIIIVNDHSTDYSRDLVTEFIKQNKNKDTEYILIDNKKNKGKSQAVKKGILASTGDLVVTQDADLEYYPKELKKFVDIFIEDCNIDFIYGNRFNNNNSFNNGIHSLGNRFITYISNLFTRPKGFAPKDMETCYKMVRGPLMRNIFKTLESDSNFGLEPELTAKLAKYRKPNGRRLNHREIDITYRPRTVQEGKKMRWFKHGFEALLEIIYFNTNSFTIRERNGNKIIKRQF